jgi:hypothetical protein
MVKQAKFAMVTEELIRELTAAEFRVYAFCDLKQGSHPTFRTKGVTYIAGQLRMHPDTVSRCLHALKERGIVALEVERDDERKSRGRPQTRVRVLHNPARKMTSPILDLITPPSALSRGKSAVDRRGNTAVQHAEKPRESGTPVRGKTAHVLRSVGVGDRCGEKEDFVEPEHLAIEARQFLDRASAGDVEEPEQATG